MRCCARPIGVGRPLKASVGCRSIADAVPRCLAIAHSVWSPRVQARRCRWCSSDLLPSRPLRTRSSHTSSLSSARHGSAPPRIVWLHGIAANRRDLRRRFLYPISKSCSTSRRRLSAALDDWLDQTTRSMPVHPRILCLRCCTEFPIRVPSAPSLKWCFLILLGRPVPVVGNGPSTGRRWFSLGCDRNRESGTPTGILLRNGPNEVRNRSPRPRYPG